MQNPLFFHHQPGEIAGASRNLLGPVFGPATITTPDGRMETIAPADWAFLFDIAEEDDVFLLDFERAAAAGFDVRVNSTEEEKP